MNDGKPMPFTEEQIACIRRFADHAAETLLQEFGAWLWKRRDVPMNESAKLTDDFLAEKRGWYV